LTCNGMRVDTTKDSDVGDALDDAGDWDTTAEILALESGM